MAISKQCLNSVKKSNTLGINPDITTTINTGPVTYIESKSVADATSHPEMS